MLGTLGDVDDRDKWAQNGWRLLACRAAMLVYLFYVSGAVAHYERGAWAVCGFAILIAFAACWLATPIPGSLQGPWRFRVLYGLLIALFLAELPFAHAQAFVLAVFIMLPTVGRLGARATPVVVALAVAALLVPTAVPSWHVSLAVAWDDVTPAAIPVVALVTFGLRRVLQDSHALAEARAELACLAAENERFRIARDLHDLLGHSLTTITVKAGLAARLGVADHARAVQEMTEVEGLARRTLGDVRATVAGYRDVNLAGELANGRQLLRAVGITADLPGAVDSTDPAHQELFGWVVREGITNVVRHSHASSCAVRLSATSIEIVDDGVGGTAPAGNGLTGLRERVAAAGGLIDAGPLPPKGWRLQVSLAPAGSAQ
jgi:two-component system, NarL family, sensor histidine kinase DesK